MQGPEDMPLAAAPRLQGEEGGGYTSDHPVRAGREEGNAVVKYLFKGMGGLPKRTKRHKHKREPNDNARRIRYGKASPKAMDRALGLTTAKERWEDKA